MKIKEVMEQTGLTDRAIRLYITNELVKPSCTETYSGRKNYEFCEADVEQLQKIALLRKADFSIEQIRSLQKGGHEAGEMLRAFLDEKRNETARGHKVIEALETLSIDDEITVDAVCERITVSFDAEELPPEDSSPSGLSLQCPYCHTLFGGSPWCPNCKQSPFPMKWYKFLIYFWLFCAAVVYAVDGFTYLMEATDTLYNSSVVSGVDVLQLIYAFVYLGLAAFALVTRYQLAGYQYHAPTFAVAFFIVEGLAVSLRPYLVWIVSSGRYGEFVPFDIPFYAVLSVLNFFYFNKRVEIFVY